MITPEQFTSRMKAKNLPSLPLTVVALGEAVQDERCTVDRILKILSMDPSLSATLLRLANSALYAGEGSVRICARPCCGWALTPWPTWVPVPRSSRT